MARRRGSFGCGWLGLLLIAGLLFLTLAGGEDSQPPKVQPTAWENPTATEPAEPSDKRPQVATVKRALAELPVKGRAPMTGYDRGLFGAAWADTNDNGCDTRNDILRRDLRAKVVQDCVVLSGLLDDPYSGDVVAFERGPVTSLDVQIDHVVSLGNAWATGAAYWSEVMREAFANDRRNLLAVRGDLNMQKQDGDAATWLPPRKAIRCTYVSMQVLTKQEYGLWVTPAEKAAMDRVLAGC